jgi:DNA-binding response OmpR family regulator
MWGTARTGPLVLLVEDDEDLREMTMQMLQLRGFDVLTARDAVDAITTCRVHENTIDLPSTDLGLPGVSGASWRVRRTRSGPRWRSCTSPEYPRTSRSRKA